MPFATRDGVRLYWRADGAAGLPAIVLLHSLGAELAQWDAVAAALAPRHRVVRLDLRGHGASDAPAGDYRLAELAADVIAVLDAAGAARATVVGLSLGGMVAMELALAAPARVAALVLACTSASLPPADWDARVSAVRAGGVAAVAAAVVERSFPAAFRARRPAAVEAFRAALPLVDRQGYAGCCAAIRDMALLDRLGAIAAPTTVVVGDADVATPAAGHGDRLVAAIPGARLVRLPTGHLPALEAPDRLAAAIEGAIDGAVAAPATGADPDGDPRYDAGLARRREVLGDAWVDRALAAQTPFTADFQRFITRVAWGEIWTRPGLDQRTRRLLVVAITAALGRWEEFRLHVRAGLEAGDLGERELQETLMQTALYAGLPAANTAFAEAAGILDSLTPRAPER
jgi:3-oxoadipate enol-lactonase / 4-carboxymuconolactone decarboxylase